MFSPGFLKGLLVVFNGFVGWFDLSLYSNSKLSNLVIRLSFSQHVPDDRGQLSHHRDQRYFRASFAFEFLEPGLHGRINPKDVLGC